MRRAISQTNIQRARRVRTGTAAALLAATATCALGQGVCDDRWLAGDGILGVDGTVNAIVSIDFDGPSPAPREVFVGGAFEVAGGVQTLNIARWDGAVWHHMGAGASGIVRALAEFDPDGAGPRPPMLAVGGDFTMVDGITSNRVALWDGATWSALGTGMTGATNPVSVFALAPYDPDGPGPAAPELIAAGRFGSAGGLAVNNIARWDGESWRALGTGVSNTVQALEVFQPEGAAAPLLIAGGSFNSAGGVPSVSRIAAWNGVAWSRLGTGTGGTVLALEAFKPFNGAPRLIVGGQFATAGGAPARNIASWDGTAWTAMSTGLPGGAVNVIRAGDPDGTGPLAEQVFAGGSFGPPQSQQPPLDPRNTARWDGATWHQLNGSTSSAVNAMELLGDGGGLLAGGAFLLADGAPVRALSLWNGATWSGFGFGVNAQIICAEPFDRDGPGPEPEQLVIGGEFTDIGGVRASRIAIGDGVNWTPIGSGINGVIRALQKWDPDGPGPKRELLVIGGDFTSAGGTPFDDIVTWDGQTFGTEYLYGLNYSGVFDLLTIDLDGPGPDIARLVAAGEFELLPKGSQFYTRHLAYWKDNEWKPFGTGEMTGYPLSMTAFDFDGAGPDYPRLVIAGSLTNIDFQDRNRVAYWDGASWRSLGPGLGEEEGAFNVPLSLTVFDPDGPGPRPERLIAGGLFQRDGAGNPLNYLAQWDGSAWLPFGTGSDGPVLQVVPVRMDAGEPDRLLAVGRFSFVDGVAASGVAAWNGAAWSPFGSGVDLGVSGATSTTPQRALAFRPSGSTAPRLYVLGDQTQAGGVVAASISTWAQDTASWASAASGGFSQGALWACGTSPDTLERARFDATGKARAPLAYTVSLGGGAGARRLRSLDVISDAVTLDLQGSVLEATGDGGTLVRAGLAVGGSVGQSPALRVIGSGSLVEELRTTGMSIGGASAARVELEGARLGVDGSAVVSGAGESGVLRIGAGGEARIGGSLVVGQEPGSSGVVEIIGRESEMRLSSEGGVVEIGRRGHAVMDIGGTQSQGGVVSTDAELASVSMGSVGGSEAEVTLNGPAALWATSQRLFSIGQAGRAVLRVSGGAAMSTSTRDAVVIGQIASGSGEVVVSGNGSAWSESGVDIGVGRSGTLRVESGGLVQAPGVAVAPGGSLEGDGMIRVVEPAGGRGAGAVVNTGVIRPGTSVSSGVLVIDGDLESAATSSGVTSSGVIEIDAGSAQVTDRLDVNGVARLAGTLRVALAPGFDPLAGTRMTVLTAQGGLQGQFDVATFPGLTGRFFRVEYVQDLGRGTQARVDVVVEAQTTGGFNSNAYLSPGTPSDALLTDLNEDGLPDLVLAVPDGTLPESAPGQVVVLLNAGSGGGAWNGFVSSQFLFATGRAPAALAAGRFRGDEQPVDIAVACAADHQVRVYRGAGGPIPSFVDSANIPSGGLRPIALRAADLDLDGDTDLVVANYGDINPPPEVQLPDRGNARTLVNSGGVFSLGVTLVTGWYPRALALLDFNDDGLPDIVTADSGTNEISTFASRPGSGGPSNFLPPVRLPTSPAPVGVEPGGLDNPKDINDLAVITLGSPGQGGSGSLMVFLNAEGGSGGGAFSPPAVLPVPGRGIGLAVLDLDDDTDADLVALVDADGTDDPARAFVIRNNTGAAGGVVLALDASPLAQPGAAILRSSDVDGDGRDDLVLIGQGSTPRRGGNGAAGGGAPITMIDVARSTPPCRGDLDGDGAVGPNDLLMLLSVFGHRADESDPARRADLTADGVVDTRDLVGLIGRFGRVCQ